MDASTFRNAFSTAITVLEERQAADARVSQDASDSPRWEVASLAHWGRHLVGCLAALRRGASLIADAPDGEAVRPAIFASNAAELQAAFRTACEQHMLRINRIMSEANNVTLPSLDGHFDEDGVAAVLAPIEMLNKCSREIAADSPLLSLFLTARSVMFEAALAAE